MPDFDAYKNSIKELVGQTLDVTAAEKLIRWVTKLEELTKTSDSRLKELERELEDAGESKSKLESAEKEMEFLIEDLMDVDRGIKTMEEVISERRPRFAA